MARKPPTTATIKRLFAFSGNACAFPECDAQMVGQDGTVLGEVCHIEAAQDGGERYNPAQTDDDRRDFKNLILFCGAHHKLTDNVNAYTAERLREMKTAHEKEYKNRPYSMPDGLAEQIRDALKIQYQITHTGSGQLSVSVGLDYSDVKAVVYDLFCGELSEASSFCTPSC